MEPPAARTPPRRGIQRLRRGGVKCRAQFVDLPAEPIDLRLKDAEATKNKVCFCRVAGRARIVEIQEVHKKKRQPSGFSPSGPRWQPSQPQLNSSTDCVELSPPSCASPAPAPGPWPPVSNLRYPFILSHPRPFSDIFDRKFSFAE